VATRCQASRRRALQFHAVLERARASIEALPGPGLQVASVCKALEEACEQANLTIADLALSYCALVDARTVVGRVVTGSYTADIEQAVSQRNRLLVGRAEGWQRLRAEWIEVMQMPVQIRKSAVWGRARPQARSLFEATVLADSAWRQHIAKCQQQNAVKAKHVWKQLECDLSRSVTVAAAALASEDLARQHAMRRACQDVKRTAQSSANREAARMRHERWLWLRSPHRTMEEIIHSGCLIADMKRTGAMDNMETRKRKNTIVSMPRRVDMRVGVC